MVHRCHVQEPVFVGLQDWPAATPKAVLLIVASVFDDGCWLCRTLRCRSRDLIKVRLVARRLVIERGASVQDLLARRL